MPSAQWISWYGFIAFSIILLGFAALVLWKLYSRADSLDGLLAEPLPPGDPGPAKASLSRFQFLIFTFVIAGLYLLLCIEAGTLIEIPGNVLALLGISGGTYVVAKTVGNKKDDPGATANKNEPAAAPPAAPARSPRPRRPASPEAQN